MSMESLRKVVDRFMDKAEEACKNGQVVRIVPKAEVVTVGEEDGWAKKAMSGRFEMLIVIEAPGVKVEPPHPGLSFTAPR